MSRKRATPPPRKGGKSREREAREKATDVALFVGFEPPGTRGLLPCPFPPYFGQRRASGQKFWRGKSSGLKLAPPQKRKSRFPRRRSRSSPPLGATTPRRVGVRNKERRREGREREAGREDGGRRAVCGAPAARRARPTTFPRFPLLTKRRVSGRSSGEKSSGLKLARTKQEKNECHGVVRVVRYRGSGGYHTPPVWVEKQATPPREARAGGGDK